jgi:photosystem II stability/assembly factor-like uncharacterized protein
LRTFRLSYRLLFCVCTLFIVFILANVENSWGAQGTAPSGSQSSIWTQGNLRLRQIGPAVFSGRVDSIAVDENDTKTYYVGTATGGLWKTVNGGATFASLFDQQSNLSIGDVAVSRSSPSTIWVGTGEANNRQSSSWGNGVYKSSDAGQTWKNMGLADTQAIGSIAIDPRNADVVYVAALGHLWGPNSERGLFKTSDGGKTWSKTLFVNDDTGVVDVVIDPHSPNILYAATYERRRTSWGFNGGGPGSALYKSTDAGANWAKLTNGLPDDGNTGRIGIAIYPRNPAIVYALIENRAGGVFRSEDKGETWTRMSAGSIGSPYFGKIIVDSNNDLRVWVLLDNALYSSDGGKNFTSELTQRVHSDFHALWIDGNDSKHLIAGTDGGIWTTDDRGHVWQFAGTLPVGQAYHVAFDKAEPYNICAGFQDNGAWCGPSRTRSAEGISNPDWNRALTGDGFYTVPDPSDANSVYAEAQEGALVRLNEKTHEWTPIQPVPKTGAPVYRFEWDSPFVVSSHDPKTIYMGANILLKSTDRGDSWVELGEDLTTGADRSKLAILGKTPDEGMLSLNYGVTWYPCISVIAESQADARILWAGTEDGNLQVSRDSGATWKNVADRVPGLPKGTWVSSIATSISDPGIAYATFDNHRSDDFGIYIYKTGDYGETWHPISSGISPKDGVAKVIREDPNNPKLLFLGTEFGAFISLDTGAHWGSIGLGLPRVPIDDIAVNPREHDLILGTHGRSIWVLDDIRPLEALTANPLPADLVEFGIRPATEWRQFISSNGFNGDSVYFASNPPEGALITYFVKDHPQHDDKLKITIRDKEGKAVREISGPTGAGMNRVNWDLRYETPNPPADIQMWAMQQGFFIYRVLPNLGMPGPYVEPGEYSVEITIGTKKASQVVQVLDDPAIKISDEDRSAHQKLTLASFQLYVRAMKAQRDLVELETALRTTSDAWNKATDQPVPANIRQALNEVVQAGEKAHRELIGPTARSGNAMNPPVYLIPQIAHLLYSFEAVTVAPTSLQQRQLAEYESSLSQVEKEVNGIRADRLTELNNKIRAANIPYIRLAPPATPPGARQ